MSPSKECAFLYYHSTLSKDDYLLPSLMLMCKYLSFFTRLHQSQTYSFDATVTRDILQVLRSYFCYKSKEIQSFDARLRTGRGERSDEERLETWGEVRSLGKMSMHQRQARYRGQEHEIRGTSSTSTTSLSVPTIVEIGVCGGLGLLAILIAFIFLVKRGKQKKDRRENLEQLSEGEEIRRAIRSTRPPEVDLGRRKSHLQVFGSKKTQVSNAWVDEDGLHGPQMANTKPFVHGSESGSSQNGWALVPLKKRQAMPNSQEAIHEGQFSPSDSYPVISPPGKLAKPPPTFALRQSYDPSLGDMNLDVPGIPRSTIRWVPHEPQKLAMKRRSISDNQLSSVLRSTSQRLRERRASQRPLSRAHSVLSQISGKPPSQRLPSPPRNKFGGNGYGDSREVLIDTHGKGRPGSGQSCDTSNYGAILDGFPTRRTPSPSKSFPWSADHVTGRRSSSPSAASDEDSLCDRKTPDLVIPVRLTSPSRRRASTAKVVNGEQRHSVHIYSEEDGGNKSAIEISTRFHKSRRDSIHALGYFDLAAQQKRLLAKPRDSENGNDPFYSGIVKSGRSSARANQIMIGPRSPPVPAYSPKRGHARKVSTMSRSFQPQISAGANEAKLPLTDISGNSAHGSPSKSQNRPESGSKLDEQLSDFQWSQESMQSLATKSSASSMDPGITKRQQQGHKRQNLVRISVRPRPRSFCPVPEESDDLNYDGAFSTSLLDLSKVPSGRPLFTRMVSADSLSRSTSLASTYSRHSGVMDNVQPPSSSVFEPRLTRLPTTLCQSNSINSMASSPTLGPFHPNLNPGPQVGNGTTHSSPSIGAYSHQKLSLPEEKETEETDDSFGSPSKVKMFSKNKARRMGRNFSFDCGTFDPKGSMFAFPPPPTPSVSSAMTSDPFSNANIFSKPPPTELPMGGSQPASPVLKRLHSPHSPQRLPNSSDFLLKNITQLRRGNSTLSTYSTTSVASAISVGRDSSPTLVDLRGGGISPSKRGAEYAGGTRNYLNLSNPNSRSSSPTKQASSIFINTTKESFSNSPSRGRAFPLSSNAASVKTVTFEELSKGPGVGLGIELSNSKSQDKNKEDDDKLCETIEREPNTATNALPSRKFKSIRKIGKYRPHADIVDVTAGLPSSSTSISTSKTDRDPSTQKPKERSFKFENYSPQHFENGSIRFTSIRDDEDDEGYDEDEIITPEDGEISESTGPKRENKAPSPEPEVQKFVGVHESSGTSTSFPNHASIPGLNLFQPRKTENGKETVWEYCPQPKLTEAPFPPIGMVITPSISPMQLSYTATKPDNSNPSNNQASNQVQPITNLNSNHQPSKSTNIISPIPTQTTSHSQIIQNNNNNNDRPFSIHYPKTSRWIWEETTPKISPSSSPDRTSKGSMKKYRAHSRNQSVSLSSDAIFGENSKGLERKMGNPLSSNPTVTSLIMERELGMKETTILDLDEANNFPTAASPMIDAPITSSANIENLDPAQLRSGGGGVAVGSELEKGDLEERDITDAIPASTSLTTTKPTLPPLITSGIASESTNEVSKGKKRKTRTRAKSHLMENIFSRHHRGMEERDEQQDKRGSLYDQEGFLKSSPVAGGEGRSRGWGVKGKR